MRRTVRAARPRPLSSRWRWTMCGGWYWAQPMSGGRWWEGSGCSTPACLASSWNSGLWEGGSSWSSGLWEGQQLELRFVRKGQPLELRLFRFVFRKFKKSRLSIAIGLNNSSFSVVGAWSFKTCKLIRCSAPGLWGAGWRYSCPG